MDTAVVTAITAALTPALPYRLKGTEEAAKLLIALY